MVAQESELLVFVKRVPKTIKWGHRQQIRTDVPVANENLSQAVKIALCLSSHDYTKDQQMILWSVKPSVSLFALYEIHKIMELFILFIHRKSSNRLTTK